MPRPSKYSSKDKPLQPEQQNGHGQSEQRNNGNTSTRFFQFTVFGLLLLQIGREMMLMGNKSGTPSAVLDQLMMSMPQAVSLTATATATTTDKIIQECGFLERQLVKRILITGGHIHHGTACPKSDAWLKEYLEEAPANKEFIFLNFGCNKGFDSLNVANVVSRKGSIFSKQKWAEALPMEDKGGVCGQGTGPDVILHNESLPKRPVEVHCVEAMPQTADALNQAAKTTTAEQHGLFIHNYAMTGTEGGGSLRFPNPVGQTGHEAYSIGWCNDQNVEHCKDVPALTIDEFVAKHVDHNDAAGGVKRRIPFMTIDTEGFDFTLMKAGQKTLQRTDYLEFEYHEVGNWKAQKLEDAIDMLKSLGFFCYWSGRDKLWRITDCWLDHFGATHQWSNVACVSPKHQPKLAKQMERVFQDTLEGKLQEIWGPIPGL